MSTGAKLNGNILSNIHYMGTLAIKSKIIKIFVCPFEIIPSVSTSNELWISLKINMLTGNIFDLC